MRFDVRSIRYSLRCCRWERGSMPMQYVGPQGLGGVEERWLSEKNEWFVGCKCSFSLGNLVERASDVDGGGP